MNTCECGRVVLIKFNTTLQQKRCPTCQLIFLTKKRQEMIIEKNLARPKRKKQVPWREKPTAEMIQYVQIHIVNPYIRERDIVNYGISICDNGEISHAGHFYPVSSRPAMRFNPQNIHGQSISGNYFKGGDIHNYRQGLLDRHGKEYLEELELQAAILTRVKAFDRVNIIMIGETYKYIHARKIWVFTLNEFNKHLKKILDAGFSFTPGI